MIVKTIKFDYFGFISNLFHLVLVPEKYVFFEEIQKMTNPEIVPKSNRSQIFFKDMKNRQNDSETRFELVCLVTSRFYDLNTVMRGRTARAPVAVARLDSMLRNTPGPQLLLTAETNEAR